MSGKPLRPFLKWPGGKQWFFKKYREYLPATVSRLYEPFLGGGAAFFSLAPETSILSDINNDLINLYQVMKESPEELAQCMRKHQKLHSKEYYYQIRAASFSNSIQAAGRFLYLNRTCYNGMYRVNHKGQFNVPIGTKTDCIYDVGIFPMYAALLTKASLMVCDFSFAIDSAKEGDFVFADPPYTVSNKQSSFIKYNQSLFTWEDQERLFTALTAARDRGAHIVLTNANFPPLRRMYRDAGFFVKTLERHSVISADLNHRGKRQELLVTSIPFRKRN